ncbi:MAG: leucine--tRNA ligase [Flavobacteriales bacterium]|nr:leucine--tRNA ligase [Flavobacteriales bacterium]
MEYNFREIEAKWQKIWKETDAYKVDEDESKEKFYVLDMFPYPSGAGLHVGHPLGYIASDVIARYKTHKGYNVLHPMGFDSFGLPAEQYAIQTGQHPAITTKDNVARYKEQLQRMGFNYDWNREVRTSDPEYYRWTQWIFSLLYESWYNNKSQKAENISTLVKAFEENGTYGVEAFIDRDWYKSLNLEDFPFGEYFSGELTATDWKVLKPAQKEEILSHYRLAYLSETWVNWCEALGTVLANDEIKDGLSERGGHPVEQRLMKQWSLRITAYADRLLSGLEEIDWQDSIKDMQRNWIGKSKGAMVRFMMNNHHGHVDVFTTRPDTIFGVSFIVLAPEHDLVKQITTEDRRETVEAYVKRSMAKTERERQSEVKMVTGEFTGAFAKHPFTGDNVPVWIADYVLAGYGTGAVMAVPSGDERDHAFAKAFDLPIPNIFEGKDVSKEAYTEKEAILINSAFLSGMNYLKATDAAIYELEEKRLGYGKINYRLRDAIFSRQRYWGEPFPVYYVDDIPHLLNDSQLPLTLPPVDKYLPTETGEPPLARAKKEDWPIFEGNRMEHNTMPGWAGSSWYFLRYMDPKNTDLPVSPERAKYWGTVDLYIGGAEHATGHLLYSRFWTKFLHDRGYIEFDEPFSKMINQGMILGRSSLVYRLDILNYQVPGFTSGENLPSPRSFPEIMVSKEIYEDWKKHGHLTETRQLVRHKLQTLLREQLEELGSMDTSNVTAEFTITPLHVDVNLVENDILNIEGFKQWRRQYNDAYFIAGVDDKYHCGYEIEKMSKRWYNVVTPDALCDQYGADTLRMYEMFLGPVEQSKPWDTQGISGVHNFLRKFWRLAHNGDGSVSVNDDSPSKKELKSLHQCIKKVTNDLERLSWNTVVSALMIAVNELTALKSNKREVLDTLLILISPYAPHFAEELWERLGHEDSVLKQPWPEFNPKYLEEDEFEYPVSFNGKMRFKMALAADLPREDVEKAVLESAQAAKYLDGKSPKKVIVVPKKIVNIVV